MRLNANQFGYMAAMLAHYPSINKDVGNQLLLFLSRPSCTWVLINGY